MSNIMLAFWCKTASQAVLLFVVVCSVMAAYEVSIIDGIVVL